MPRHLWSAGNSDASLRHTAAAAAVTGHNCEIALDMLAERARQLGNSGLAESFTAAAEATFTARSRWLDVVQRWNGQVVTAAAAPQQPAELRDAASDLAVWSGRLVFADPAWTPERDRGSDPRIPEELAQGEDDIARAVTAIHHSADALHRIAEAEMAQTQVIAEAGQLYVPARSLPPERRVARLYSPALPSQTHDLACAYQDAEVSAARLAGAMDLAAVETRAPSQVLTLARAATGRADEPAARPPDGTMRAGRRLPGPVVRLMRDKGVTRPELLAMAEELDNAAKGPGIAERQLVLRQARPEPQVEIEREAGG